MRNLCSADGSIHTESNKLYCKVKHRYRPNLSPRQRPTAKSRHDQAELAASAEAQGATHRARPRSPSHNIYIYSKPGRRTCGLWSMASSAKRLRRDAVASYCTSRIYTSIIHDIKRQYVITHDTGFLVSGTHKTADPRNPGQAP